MAHIVVLLGTSYRCVLVTEGVTDTWLGNQLHFWGQLEEAIWSQHSCWLPKP